MSLWKDSDWYFSKEVLSQEASPKVPICWLTGRPYTFSAWLRKGQAERKRGVGLGIFEDEERISRMDEKHSGFFLTPDEHHVMYFSHFQALTI